MYCWKIKGEIRVIFCGMKCMGEFDMLYLILFEERFCCSYCMKVMVIGDGFFMFFCFGSCGVVGGMMMGVMDCVVVGICFICWCCCVLFVVLFVLGRNVFVIFLVLLRLGSELRIVLFLLMLSLLVVEGVDMWFVVGGVGVLVFCGWVGGLVVFLFMKLGVWIFGVFDGWL